MRSLGKIRRQMNEALELPAEISGLTYVRMNEGRSMEVENHRGVICFDDTYISLKASDGKLSVTGTELSLKAMAETKIVIEGNIKAVEWE